jgi:hypothetical protein
MSVLSVYGQENVNCRGSFTLMSSDMTTRDANTVPNTITITPVRHFFAAIVFASGNKVLLLLVNAPQI